jgi:hypothetical protein
MAQYLYRSNIKDSLFPLLSEDLGQTVLVGTVANEQSQENAPQIAYAHNMMPTAEGYTSVAYQQIVSGIPVGDQHHFQDVRVIYSTAFTRRYIAATRFGTIYVYDEVNETWNLVPFDQPVAASTLTMGTVNGITYLFFRGFGCYRFEDSSEQLQRIPLTGITESSILGITASSGYLVAYTEHAIAWSSALSPSDFNPSQTTGAGGGQLSDLDGKAILAVPNNFGFIVWSEANAVSATFTGNSAYPFKFREISNSRGALTLDSIAYEGNSREHYAFSKAGLQSVDTQNAQTLLPEVTDFLAGSRLEDFDETTSTLSVTNLTSTMLKKVKLVASRYLVISYGVTEFTHALVYDLSLQKLGKLKFTHVDVFEYTGTATEIAKNNLALLKKDGTGYVLDWSVNNTASSGVIILGRYQFVRNRFLKLLEVSAENVESDATFSCKAMLSINGRDISSTVDATVRTAGTKIREFFFKTNSKNALLVFIGKMDLNTVLIKFTTGGKR